MKRLIVVFFLFVFFNIHGANAESTCDYELQIKLSNIAANINVDYEIIEKIYDITEGKFVSDPTGIELVAEGRYVNYPEIQLYILNITQDVSIKVVGKNGFEHTYYYEDTSDGRLEINLGYPEKIVNYDIFVVSNHNDCIGEELTKYPLTTPKINEYAYSVACEDVDEYFCNRYITEEIHMSENDLITKAMESKRKKEEQELPIENKSWWNRIQSYLLPVGIGISCILGVAGIVFLIQRRRSRII